MKVTDIGDLWVAEYSNKQMCFNVDSLRNALDGNRTLVQEKENTGYLIFALCRTQEEAGEACEEMRKIQGNRKEAIGG